MSVTADCNRASLPDTDEDGVLTVESGPVTLEFCGPESRSEQFVGYPNYAAGYFFDDGGSLFIDLFADGGTLEFASTEEQP